MTTKWTVSGHYTFENKQMQMIMNVPIIRPIILNEMNHQFICVAVWVIVEMQTTQLHF